MLLGFFSVLSVVAFILSCAALYSGVRIATVVRELLRQKAPYSPSRVESLETSVEEMGETLRELANKVKMMRVRTAVHHTKDATANPDPYQNPDEWRKQMNRTLTQRKIGQ